MHLFPSKISAWAVLAVVTQSMSWQAVAQSPSTGKATTWQDLGFNQLPQGFATDWIPLFEGLNEARGTWSFEGEIAGDKAVETIKGNLKVGGNPTSGMVPTWQFAWTRTDGDPGNTLIFNVMAGPNKDGFDLMLIRFGPSEKKPGQENAKPRGLPTPFKGKWNGATKTITWTERDLSAGSPARQPAKETSKLSQTFEMTVTADGKIQVRNSKNPPPGMLTSARVIARTAKPPVDPITLTGKHSFKTAAEVLDPRIKPFLPPQATEISLLSERNGHYARYKVDENHFKKFLDGLWEADKGRSAHKRESMSGEGKPVNREAMGKCFQAAGWPPLDKAIQYHSPSRSNGAMTTFYYDREAGIAYQDTGYW